MKRPLVGWVLGLGAALVMVSILTLLANCQAGCSQHAWSEDFEPQPAWVSCDIRLECLS